VNLWFYLMMQLLAPPDAASGIEAYPGSVSYPVGDQAVVNGHALRLHHFVTKDGLDQVVGYYQKLWEDSGQIVTVQRGEPGKASVGYVDLQDGRFHSISLWRSRDQTHGFPAVLEGAPYLQALAVPSGFDLPILDEGRGVLTYENQERGAYFRTVNYSNRLSLDKNESFLLIELGQRGFSLEGEQPLEQKGEVRMFDFSKGAKRITATLAWLSGDATSAVFLWANYPAPRPGRSEEP
jgi:hypothetical protein